MPQLRTEVRADRIEQDDRPSDEMVLITTSINGNVYHETKEGENVEDADDPTELTPACGSPSVRGYRARTRGEAQIQYRAPCTKEACQRGLETQIDG